MLRSLRLITKLGLAAAAAAGFAAGRRMGRREAERPGPPGRKRPSRLELLKLAVAKWNEDQAQRLGASLSFYALFSMAPLVLIAMAVVGLVFGESAARGLVSSHLEGYVGATQAQAIERVIVSLGRRAAGGFAGVVGFVILLGGASQVVAELQASLDQIFGVPPSSVSLLKTIERRVVSIVFVLGVGFLLLGSLVVESVAQAVETRVGEAKLPAVMVQEVNLAITFLVMATLFTLTYRFLPQARASWKDLWRGGVFTAALFILGNIVLGMYLGRGGPASAYGAAGSFVVVLLWVYYCAQILYFGAELTVVFARERGGGIRLPDRAAPLTVGKAMGAFPRLRPSAEAEGPSEGRERLRRARERLRTRMRRWAPSLSRADRKEGSRAAEKRPTRS
jgi:membrane protein